MDFKHFHYVLKVAELKNITKAANELYVSQPALSSYIKKIEEDFGTQIFDRTTSPLSLTWAGEQYVKTGKKIVGLYKDLQENVTHASEMDKGKIVLGIPQARAAFMLPKILPGFTSNYPQIEIETQEEKTALLKDKLKKGWVDVAILPRYPGSPSFDEDLNYEVIYRETLYLVSQEPLLAAPYEEKQLISSLDVLRDREFILLKKGHGIRDAIDRIFREYHFNPHIKIETTSNETAYRLSSSGMGIAIVPEISIELSRSIEPLYIYRLGEKGIQWEVILLHRKEDENNHIIQLFANYTRAVFQPHSADWQPY